MKLSKDTLGILKNFAKINPLITIFPGNVIRVRRPEMFAQATVEETFPVNVNLNLGLFLPMLGSFSDPALTFQDNHILLTGSDGAKAEYTCDDVPPSDKKLKALAPMDCVEFFITARQWEGIRKTILVPGGSVNIHFVLDGRSKDVRIEKSWGTGQFLFSTETSHQCNLQLEYQLLRIMMRGGYQTTLRPSFVEFKGLSVTYLVGCDPRNSVWNGQPVESLNKAS
jgi:hypothetical protein